MKLNASCWMIESKLTDSCQICECALWLCNTNTVCVWPLGRLAAWLYLVLLLLRARTGRFSSTYCKLFCSVLDDMPDLKTEEFGFCTSFKFRHYNLQLQQLTFCNANANCKLRHVCWGPTLLEMYSSCSSPAARCMIPNFLGSSSVPLPQP